MKDFLLKNRIPLFFLLVTAAIIAVIYSSKRNYNAGDVQIICEDVNGAVVAKRDWFRVYDHARTNEGDLMWTIHNPKEGTFIEHQFLTPRGQDCFFNHRKPTVKPN